MYEHTLYSGDIIEAFRRHVPSCYVRDFRPAGFITIGRGYKDLPRRGDGLVSHRVYRQAIAITLASIPQGNVTARDIYRGINLVQPGWKSQLRKASAHLTDRQRHRIQRDLHLAEWPGG